MRKTSEKKIEGYSQNNGQYSSTVKVIKNEGRPRNCDKDVKKQ